MANKGIGEEVRMVLQHEYADRKGISKPSGILSRMLAKQCCHDEFYEDRACDAICAQCGTNLGFVKNARDAGKKEKFLPMDFYYPVQP